MLLESGLLHHQGLGEHAIVTGLTAPAGSRMYPSQKIPLTLVGTTTQGLPIPFDFLSQFLASFAMPCPIHFSPTRGVEIAATIHTNVCATSLTTRSSTWASPLTVTVALTI